MSTISMPGFTVDDLTGDTEEEKCDEVEGVLDLMYVPQESIYEMARSCLSL
jgi:hypothetical protein